MKRRRSDFVAVLVVACGLAVAPARADDQLKVAIGQMDTWVNQAAVLGQSAGIFKKHGIQLENFATQGSGETMQAVASNAAQVGVGVGTLAVLRAYAQGAPIRIVGASFTGVGDLYWYVRTDSPTRPRATPSRSPRTARACTTWCSPSRRSMGSKPSRPRPAVSRRRSPR
jgi:NitT/TauT family transport system substrate-binding protein